VQALLHGACTRSAIARADEIGHAQCRPAEIFSISAPDTPDGFRRMLSRTRMIWILGPLTAFGPISTDMYLPAFPALMRDLNADVASVQATLSAFLAGLAGGQLIYGPLSDRLGRRGPLIFGLALYVIAAVACALSPNIESLWFARFAQAIGACAVAVTARAIVRDQYSGAEGARFFSALMLFMGTAPIVGPLIGAFLVTKFSWRAIFWLLAAYSTATLLAVLFGLPETLPKERRSRGGILHALESYVILLKDRRFLAPTLAANCIFAGLFAFIALGPFIMIDLYGFSPEAFGMLFSILACSFLLASQLNARLVVRIGPVRMLRASLIVFFVASFVLLFNVWSGFGGLAGFIAPLFFCFSVVGIAPTNALALAQEHYPHAAGSATALFGSFQFGIGAIVGSLTGLIYNGTPVPMAVLFAIAAVIALVVNFGLTPRRTETI
jgi:DHA1 family bicyclomycin/chloramphenicol resistance-like MFS transporter